MLEGTKLDRVKRFVRSNYVTPLSKSVNNRHLALEPLCCIQSCKIRSGCVAVGAFEGIGVLFMMAYTIAQLRRISESGQIYDDIEVYADFGEHPAPYVVLLNACVIRTLGIMLFVFGVRRFHARLIKAHFVSQLIVIIVCILIIVAVSVQVASSADNGNSDTTPDTAPVSPTSTAVDTNTVQNGPRRHLKEQLGLLTCCLYLLMVEIWGATVVHDCYKYFKLCQVLVNLAAVKTPGPTQGGGAKGGATSA